MDPNSLKFDVNSSYLVHMCGYKLPIIGQNLAQKGLAYAKILLIAFFEGGYSPCIKCYGTWAQDR